MCKVVVLRNEPIAFLTSWLPSPSSLLKLPNVACATDRTKLLAPVVQKEENTIQWINLYPVDSAMVSLILNHWIVIYRVDSTIQHLNNRAMVKSVRETALTT